MIADSRRQVRIEFAVQIEIQLPLRVFAWQPGMHGAGLKNAALYLIRPDGYVALADPKAEPERLRQYFAERGGLGELALEVSNRN